MNLKKQETMCCNILHCDEFIACPNNGTCLGYMGFDMEYFFAGLTEEIAKNDLPIL